MGMGFLTAVRSRLQSWNRIYGDPNPKQISCVFFFLSLPFPPLLPLPSLLSFLDQIITREYLVTVSMWKESLVLV